MDAEFLTTAELAEHLKTSASTVRWWRHVSYGPPGIRVGRRVLYRTADVEAWLAQLPQQSRDSS